jgi:predicted LPLAT superfamily acyltransferase
MVFLTPLRHDGAMPSIRPQNAAAEWAEPGIGGNWQQKFFYWLMRLGGKSRGYHMANIVTFWYVLFYPSIRRRCSFYLNRRFPRRRWFDTYRLVRTYGRTLVDMMVLQMFGPDSVGHESPDHDRLSSLCAGERGFVLLHAHVGCWQIGMSTLKEFSKKVSIVMIPEARTVELFGSNARVIDPREGLQSVMAMTEALLSGEIVAMMGDRLFGSDQNAVPVKFLGGRALFPVTPFRLASAAQVPVVVMTVPKIGANLYSMRLTKIIEVPPNLGRATEPYAPYAQQFADCIEQFTRDFPWQYHNFFDLWRPEPVQNSAAARQGGESTSA